MHSSMHIGPSEWMLVSLIPTLFVLNLDNLILFFLNFNIQLYCIMITLYSLYSIVLFIHV